MLIKSNKLYFLILILFSKLGLAQPNQINPEKFLQEVQLKYSSFKSFLIEYSQEISTIGINEKQLINGKVYFSKPNRYRVENENQIIVCDGQTIYSFTKKLKRVVITNYEENFFSPQKLLTDIPKFSDITYNGQERIHNKDFYKFSLSPTRSNPEFKILQLWIDANKIIWKIHTVDWAGNKYTFQILDLNFNQELKEELFKFKIPPGVKVVDFR